MISIDCEKKVVLITKISEQKIILFKSNIIFFINVIRLATKLKNLKLGSPPNMVGMCIAPLEI